MIHYGDICKLHGDEIPTVDVITGGSPCQDLSVAGARAGLAGERSGLFMEQIRIIKEMRERGRTDDNIRLCRFAVWENVPGALSSGTPKGEDFRIVLEEFCKIFEPNAVVPRPTDGKWANAGCIVGSHGSIAWRIHDAQFFGVPQRRKRICVLCDFDGFTAPEILFDPQLQRETKDDDSVKIVGHPGRESRCQVQSVAESLPRNTEPGEQARKGIAAGTEGSVGEASSYTLKIRGGREVDSLGKKAGKGALWQTEKAGTVAAAQDQTLIQSL